MKIDSIATNVKFDAKGFWKTPVSENISYTENGHNSIKEDEKNSFWFDHRQKCLVRAMGNNLAQPVLDVGGGNGLFSLYLQSENIDSILIEPGIAGVINAKENGVKNIINGSLFDAGLVNSSIGSAIALDVLEHIEDDEKFLCELNRILKDQGQLILTVPAFQFLFSDFDKQVGHFRRYTLGDLQDKMIRNGFEIEHRSYFFWFLPLPILIGRFIVNKFKKKAKRKSTGHINKSRLIGTLLRLLLWPEISMIKSKIKIPFGSSCLIVAKKVKNND